MSEDGAFDAVLNGTVDLLAEEMHAAFVNYVPSTHRSVQLATEFGADDPEAGQLPVINIEPGQPLVVRLLPAFNGETRPSLRIARHYWRDWSVVCPVLTHPDLVEAHSVSRCRCCEANMRVYVNYIVFVLIGTNPPKPVCLRLPERYQNDLKELVKAGFMNPNNGRFLKLTPDERCLNATPLAKWPVKLSDLQMTAEYRHVRRSFVLPGRLAHFGAAYTGWLNAGQPEPQPGRAQRLRALFSGTTLVPIVWGCKAPSKPDWQNVSYAESMTEAYASQLDAGNVGLLGGADERAQIAGLVPTGVVVIVDADSDEFAQELLEYNPWLSRTLCVIGNRGCKWFFRVCGSGAERCCTSTKIMRKGEPKPVGDWIADRKQGVVDGLHPIGKMYTLLTERRTFRTIDYVQLQRFLPRDCYLASSVRRYIDVYKGTMGLKATEGPILDEHKLDNVVYHADGSIQAACPACQSEGHDSGGEHLKVFPSGRYCCARYIHEEGQEKAEHNRMIYQLAGREKESNYDYTEATDDPRDA